MVLSIKTMTTEFLLHCSSRDIQVFVTDDPSDETFTAQHIQNWKNWRITLNDF